MVAPVPSPARRKKNGSFLSLLKTSSSCVFAVASSGQERRGWGQDSASAKQDAQGDAWAPDQPHQPKGFLEIILYLLLPVAAAGVQGSSNFGKHILPLGLKNKSSDMDPQYLS